MTIILKSDRVLIISHGRVSSIHVLPPEVMIDAARRLWRSPHVTYFFVSGPGSYPSRIGSRYHSDNGRIKVIHFGQFKSDPPPAHREKYAVVSGSGIFSGEWAEERAEAYGIKREDLGEYYAARHLPQAELFPEDIAAVMFILVGPEMRESCPTTVFTNTPFRATVAWRKRLSYLPTSSSVSPVQRNALS